MNSRNGNLFSRIGVLLYIAVAMVSAIGGMISIIPFWHEQDESCSHDC